MNNNRWRDFAISRAAHNVVTVDGTSYAGSAPAALARAATAATYDDITIRDPRLRGRRPATADRLLPWSRLVARRRSRHLQSRPDIPAALASAAGRRSEARWSDGPNALPQREPRDLPAPCARSGERRSRVAVRRSRVGIRQGSIRISAPRPSKRSSSVGSVRYVTLLVPAAATRSPCPPVRCVRPWAERAVHAERGRPARSGGDRPTCRGGEDPPHVTRGRGRHSFRPSVSG